MQLAALSEEKLLEVKRTQQRKNNLEIKLGEEKRKEKFRLLKAGTFRSSIYEQICVALDEAYQRDVEALRDGLIFYLQFSSASDGNPGYKVDYSLDFEARYEIVKAYYDSTYTNAEERFTQFKKDLVATKYLGELYAILFNLYKSEAGV
jgi:hypothetical protein